MEDKTKSRLVITLLIILSVSTVFFGFAYLGAVTELDTYVNENIFSYMGRVYEFNRGEIIYLAYNGEVFFDDAEVNKCYFIEDDELFFDYYGVDNYE